MTNLKLKCLKAISAVSFVVAAFQGVPAQSTVFNIPSTDIQTRKRLYVEADFTAHVSSFKSGGYQTYGPRIIYGVNRRVEVGLNAFYTRTSPSEPVEIQPNFKVQLYQNESEGTAVAAGAVVFVPLAQRATNTTRAMVYSVASKSIKGDYGPRLTAGAYTLVGSFADGTTKKGLLLGYEQPVHKKVSIILDWSTGRNDFGYVVAGAGITLSPKSLLYVGYNIGNHGRGNNALGVYYGMSF
ncbi:MAG TPA: hypothetical protein VK557_05005 [Pyrinomonadaceae bacterium]|nr:hypothetical protein [Pyrinomonadaceae bacterium]